jgi:hypothetical protein
MHSGLSSSPKDVRIETSVSASNGNESAVAAVMMKWRICVT